ncbi:DUF3520 domain-containing protein [Olivibacter sp. SDN3]|uniref:YfbK domain-containing protein n=1 Tax=Olivibacter sp. SDN3 TaxID=2764720 RepID=UPI00165133D2|nr:DUF3520 domain-containing protein [Olivibacter sp. SDN3]
MCYVLYKAATVGHTVTALYEIVPVGVKGNFPGHVDPLKYQDDNVTPILKGSLVSAWCSRHLIHRQF